ncbi:XkdX family protein [Clostridium beijerinckii]|nr:XkdX family protein [Clostridium beijerinckii]NRT78648.1 putative XkdX family phage protein [Clostridium beijerinckii]OOM41372.1 hypothetical protein CBEIJ_44900 [Clostridium beijerinckii]
MYSYIKKYYDLKLYNNDDVKIFVQANWITTDEYKTITNIDYAA